jgi:hypothetical protein
MRTLAAPIRTHCSDRSCGSQYAVTGTLPAAATVTVTLEPGSVRRTLLVRPPLCLDQQTYSAGPRAAPAAAAGAAAGATPGATCAAAPPSAAPAAAAEGGPGGA